jgi:hypothetical protein
MGVDPMDHFKELAHINEVLDQYDITLDTDPRRLSKQGQTQMQLTDKDENEKTAN